MLLVVLLLLEAIFLHIKSVITAELFTAGSVAFAKSRCFFFCPGQISQELELMTGSLKHPPSGLTCCCGVLARWRAPLLAEVKCMLFDQLMAWEI